jgi:hypothetical protein
MIKKYCKAIGYDYSQAPMVTVQKKQKIATRVALLYRHQSRTHVTIRPSADHTWDELLLLARI